METARKQVANTLDQQMREPGYWTQMLSTLEYRGRTIGSILEAPAAYQAFTAGQVKERFGKYWKPERRFRLWVAPAGTPSAPQKDSPE
jgi:hypothetical protein